MQISLNSLTNSKEIIIKNKQIELKASSFEELYVEIVACFLNGEIKKDGEIINVLGEAKVDYTSQCYRCGEKVNSNIILSIDSTFDLKSEDYSEIFNGKTLDISALVCENMLLEIPTQILCKPDCLGRCGKCGKNLNEGKCYCEEDREGIVNPANPFNSLRKLLKRKEINNGTSKGKIKQSKNSKKSS